MAKATATQNKDLSPKTLSTPKDGFIQKKKSQKFKQTPKGKISLINGSKASNNNNMKQQQLQKQKNFSPEKFSEKNKELKKVDSPKTDKKQSSKKELSKKGLNKSKANESDSDEDINEGVVLEEEELMEETDDTDSEEESDEDVQDKKVLNVLGASLADDTEEDDEEFKIEDKKGKAQVNKGVKMFKGVKSSNKSSDKSSTETSLVDDEEDDEIEDDDSEDVEEEEDDDNEEVGDEEDDDEEEEDDDEEEESENEGEESVLGTKALLDQSLADDDDDEDFVEPEGHEEDDDISDEDEEEGEADNSTLDNSYQSNSSKDANSSYEKSKADNNTIFVGNLPKEVTDKQLKKLFKKFGNIDAIRIRGIVPDSPQTPKKVAAITKKFHPKLQTVYAYVRFVSEESAKAALALNGTLFEGNHLRVDVANKTEKKYDAKKSVFLGNLPFKINHETVRKHFESCGEIESVHVVRDNATGIGKGIGYVNFKTEDAVALAFELNGTTILNREVIVKPYVEHHQGGKYRKRSHSKDSDKQGSPRKQFKQNSGKSSSTPNKESPKKVGKEQKFEKKQASPQQKSMFQGQKADKDKKKKESKVDKRKKILAKKLTAKPKKPSN